MKNWLSFLKSYFETHPFTGVLPDTRPYSVQINDVQHDEVALGTSVTWVEKPTWKKYTKRFQNGSGSCLAQTAAKTLEVDKGGVYSALDIYDLRSNKNWPDGAGMIPYESLSIKTEHGVTSETLLPSQDMSEAEMNKPFVRTPEMKVIEDATKGGLPVVLPIDIDKIAQVLDKGYGVNLCFSFYGGEWTEVPTLMNYYLGVHHGVAAVDRTLYKGQKALIIEDSAFPTTATPDGQRIITEEFLLNRCTFAGYVLKDEAKPVQKPDHIFTVNLGFGTKSNEVKLLQDRLKYEGYLDKRIDSTGNFLNLTKDAVIAYQKAHGISQTGFVGPLTRSALNSS